MKFSAAIFFGLWVKKDHKKIWNKKYRLKTSSNFGVLQGDCGQSREGKCTERGDGWENLPDLCRVSRGCQVYGSSVLSCGCREEARGNPLNAYICWLCCPPLPSSTLPPHWPGPVVGSACWIGSTAPARSSSWRCTMNRPTPRMLWLVLFHLPCCLLGPQPPLCLAALGSERQNQHQKLNKTQVASYCWLFIGLIIDDVTKGTNSAPYLLPSVNACFYPLSIRCELQQF